MLATLSVAWFLPSATRPVRGQYVENCRCSSRFVKNVNPISCKCKICGIIHYLVWKGKTPVEVYNEVKTAYGDKAMNHTSVFKWCYEFKNSRTSVHEDQRSKIPSIGWWNCGKNRKCAPWWLKIDCGWTFCDVSANLQIFVTRNHHRNPRILDTVER